MDNFPHVPAAFINAIREEGTKDEACDHLQRTWNQLCSARSQITDEQNTIATLRDELAEARRERDDLTKKNREMAMQSLADLGQAQEAYERQLDAEAAARTARETAIREAAEVVPNGWTGKPHMSNMDYGPNTAAAARAAILALLDSPPAGSKTVEG